MGAGTSLGAAVQAHQASHREALGAASVSLPANCIAPESASGVSGPAAAPCGEQSQPEAHGPTFCNVCRVTLPADLRLAAAHFATEGHLLRSGVNKEVLLAAGHTPRPSTGGVSGGPGGRH